MAEETVNINPDGSTTFEGQESTMPPVEDAGDAGEGAEEVFEEIAQGGDPAIYLLLVVVLLGVLFYIYRRKSKEDEDDFFGNLDGEKVCPHQMVMATEWDVDLPNSFYFSPQTTTVSST